MGTFMFQMTFSIGVLQLSWRVVVSDKFNWVENYKNTELIKTEVMISSLIIRRLLLNEEDGVVSFKRLILKME